MTTNHETATQRVISRRDVKHLIHWLAIGGGAGLARRAPGTWGSVVGVIVFAPLLGLADALYLAVLFAVIAAGIPICHKTSRDWGVHDHGAIVWDEIAGMGIALFALPLSAFSVVMAFVLFRLFDIWKPWPISVLDQRIPGGAGIMVDDLAAGVLAAVVGHGIMSLLPGVVAL